MTRFAIFVSVLVLLQSGVDSHTRGGASTMAVPKYNQANVARKLQTETGWNQIGQSINGDAAGDTFGYAVAMNEDGSRMVVSAPKNDAGGGDAGGVKVLEYQTNVWVLLGSPIRGLPGSGIGQDVAISGDGMTVAVGSFRLEPYIGYIRIYRFNTVNSDWRLLKEIKGREERDRFGGSLSLNYDGTRLAVGAAYAKVASVARGKTEVYEQKGSGTTWDLIGEVFGGAGGERSGHAVALSSDGTTLVIGEIAADPTSSLTDAGTTAVFKSTSSLGGWNQLGSDIPGLGAGDSSGFSVAVSEDGMIVAIGSPMLSSQGGMVRVFSYDSSQDTWVQLGSNIFTENPGELSKFGYSVSLSSNGLILAVGEPNDTSVGRTSIFYYNSDSDSWVRDITLSSGGTTGKFGYAVALSGSGSRLVVGAPEADQPATDSGTARVYEFQTSDWLLNVADFEANFGSGTAPEFTLSYEGTSPSAGPNNRRYQLTILLPGCDLGEATSNIAIVPVVARGLVAATQTFQLVAQLDVDADIIRSSGFYSDSGAGTGNIAFCVQMDISEGNEVKVTRRSDISVDLDMSQDFSVGGFGEMGIGDVKIRQTTQFKYGFSPYFCNEALAPVKTLSVAPGGEVSICLEADPNEPVIVDNVKSVSFQNTMAPLLGVALIDAGGNPLSGTTTKACSDGVCRVAAMTVPRLYEYVDSSGKTQEVADGASIGGTVIFAFPNRRLQGGEEGLEATFNVKLDLAEPPNRNNFASGSSPSYSLPVVAALSSCLAGALNLLL